MYQFLIDIFYSFHGLTVVDLKFILFLQFSSYFAVEEIYVGVISATKPCRNLLEPRKTLLKPIEWCYSILLVCDKYNTTNWSNFPSMKINHMQSIIHKTPKSIATSRLHCI